MADKSLMQLIADCGDDNNALREESVGREIIPIVPAGSNNKFKWTVAASCCSNVLLIA